MPPCTIRVFSLNRPMPSDYWHYSKGIYIWLPSFSCVGTRWAWFVHGSSLPEWLPGCFRQGTGWSSRKRQRRTTCCWWAEVNGESHTHTVFLLFAIICFAEQFFVYLMFFYHLLLHRGRGMPRGAPRGAMRGGVPRGGPGGRGSAPRGGPSGRGGLPSPSTRGGSAPRSRPPAAGTPRMLPSAAMSHQQHQVPPSSQSKPDAYEDYVRAIKCL